MTGDGHPPILLVNPAETNEVEVGCSTRRKTRRGLILVIRRGVALADGWLVGEHLLLVSCWRRLPHFVALLIKCDQTTQVLQFVRLRINLAQQMMHELARRKSIGSAVRGCTEGSVCGM